MRVFVSFNSPTAKLVSSNRTQNCNSACLPQTGAEQTDFFFLHRSYEGVGLRSLPAVAGREISL
jgi:hypothetical protein